jgi:hypothetical protein
MGGALKRVSDCFDDEFSNLFRDQNTARDSENAEEHGEIVRDRAEQGRSVDVEIERLRVGLEPLEHQHERQRQREQHITGREGFHERNNARLYGLKHDSFPLETYSKSPMKKRRSLSAKNSAPINPAVNHNSGPMICAPA